MSTSKTKFKASPELLAYGRSLGQRFSTAIIMFHEAVATRLGLNAAEWRCLGLLDLHGPSTASRLAEWSGFTTGAITGIVDRLEKAGYAERRPNPHDRRSVIIHPLRLPELRKEVEPIFESLGRAMAEAAKGYSPKELAAIGTYLAKAIEVLRAETVKISKSKWANGRRK